MREETIRIFKFEELGEDAKEKAIESNRQFNVDHDWWDHTFDSICDFCELIGIEVSKRSWTNSHGFKGNSPNIYFTVYGQSGGVSVDSEAFDLMEVAEKVRAESWKREFPELETGIGLPPKVRDLLKRPCMHGMVTASLKGKNQFGNSTSCDWSIEDTYGNQENCDRLERALTEFAQWGESLATDLECLFLKWIEREYEYLTSDDCISESLISNEMEFTEDGSEYN